MSRIATYLIYKTDDLSAIEISRAVENQLVGLGIQAVACYGEGKSNLIFHNDDQLQPSFRKKAGLIFQEGIEKLRKQKDPNYLTDSEKAIKDSNLKKHMEKLLREEERKRNLKELWGNSK